MIIDDSMKIFLVAIVVKQFTTKKAKAGTVYKAQVLARSKFPYRFTQEWWKKFHENNALFFDHEADVVAFHKVFREDSYFVDFEQRTLAVFFIPAHDSAEAKQIFKNHVQDWKRNKQLLIELGFEEILELEAQKPSGFRILFSYEVQPFLPDHSTDWEYLAERVVIPVPSKMSYKAAWDEFVDMARREQEDAAGRD